MCTFINFSFSYTSDLIAIIDEKAQSLYGVHTVGMLVYRMEVPHELNMA